MNKSENYKELYRRLLEYVVNSGKQDTLIHILGCKDNLPAVHTLRVYLQGKRIGGALNTLTSSLNADVSNRFLHLVKNEFGCSQEITDEIQYDNIVEKINGQNAIGYFACFLIKNDLSACEEISQRLQKLFQKKTQKNQIPMKITGLEAEKQKLEEKLTEAKQTQQEQEKVIKKLSQEKSVLENRAQKLKEQADTIRSLNEEINKLLKSNEDLKIEIDQIKQEKKLLVNNETTEKTSLFLLEENNVRRYLQRVADFDGNRLIRFSSDNDREKRFDNRDQFSFQMEHFDGLDAGTAQIFDWFAKPKQQDPEKDEANIIFKSDKRPIELIDLHAHDSGEALQNLKNGFQWLHFCENGQYLYVFSHRDDGAVETLYCPKETLKKENDLIHIDPTIVSLEQYSIEKKDLLAVPFFNFESEIRIFYAKLELGEPQKRMLLCTPHEVTAHFVREYATETKLKNIISGRQNWQAFRGFIINAGCIEPICRKIAAECGYDERKAKECLNQFLNCSEQYLSGTDEDTQLVSTLVERNPSLLKKYKTIVQEEWEKENTEKLKAIGEQLTAQSVLLQGIQQEREKLSKDIRAKQSELTALQQEIDSKRQIGDDTLHEVRQKICEARKDTAGFLAELSVYFPQSETTMINNGKQNASAAFHDGLLIKDGLAEEEASISVLLNVIRDNIEDAGVGESYADAVAAWLLSAYCEHIPLLLAGPATAQLADSISCGTSGRMAARLTCNGEWNQEIANQAVTSNSKVVLVENPFCGEWMERMPSLALSSKKLFLFATPFSEDLTIEPKSLYQYMLPVFTDSFICTVPQEPEIGSVWTGQFPKLKGNGEGAYRMSFLKPTGLLKTQANRLFRRFENFLEKPADFYEFLLCILPLAKMINYGQKAADEISDSKWLSEDEQKYLLTLLG